MQRRVLSSAGLCLLIGLLSCLVQPARGSASPITTFINVGEGDAALLQDGSGFNVLIDGGKPGAGPAVLSALRAHAATHLNVILASHADSDHIGGLISVLQAGDIQVDAVEYNGYPGSTATWTSFASAVATRGLSLQPVQFPTQLAWGKMTVYVLNPAKNLSNPDQNDASEVVRVDEDGLRELFTGDIDATIEATVVARRTPLASQVLKVAHHGSAYSSGAPFLAAVQPEDAVISVGQNSYGHPSNQAIARLQAAGAAIYRTDLDGDIQVINDGGGAFTLLPEYRFRVYLPVLSR